MFCVVVLGMHRSGTSIVARILENFGVCMGHNFRAADESSPDGYFEDLLWRDLNKKIINAVGGTWYIPPSLMDVQKACTGTYGMGIAIEELVRSKQLHIDTPWGFKDPRSCLTIHAIHKYLPEPRYVLVLRSEEQIVESLIQRAALRGYEEPLDRWITLTRTYVNQATRFLETITSPVYIVRYEGLVARETAPWMIEALGNFVNCADTELMQKAFEMVKFKTWLDKE